MNLVTQQGSEIQPFRCLLSFVAKDATLLFGPERSVAIYSGTI